MKGSEREALFDSFNVNPKLFINEVFNVVDDMVDGAFELYEQEASSLLGCDGAERSGDLRKGISSIHNMIQAVLDKQLDMWEKYCLWHCFVVPEGFSLPKSVGNESAELHRELQALEKQSILSSSYAGSINEALQLFEQNSVYDTSQEIVRIASELRNKMEKLKIKRMEEVEHVRTERLYNPNRDHSLVHHSKGLSDAKLEEIRELAADMGM